MSNEDRGPSPADGPAKVKRKRNWNFVAEIEPYIDALEVLFQDCLAAYRNPWSQETGEGFVARARALGIELRSEYDESDNLLALSALLSLIPAEQVVQAMVEETREAIGVLLMPWCMSEITKTRGQRDEALARAEKAEAKLRRQASTMAHRLDEVANAAERTLESLGIIRLRDAVQRARIANGAEPGSDYADLLNRAEKAETDAAASWQFAELARVKAKEAGDCVFCKGTGRSCGNKHCGWPWCASCKACDGTGRKTEESDGKEATDTPSKELERDSVRGDGLPHCDVHGGISGGLPGVPEATRPPGIPTSATIWAEVVDGLGRKVGAWFVPPFMKGDLGHVDMYDPEQPSAPWAWSPRCDSQWKGSFDERLTPSTAAQCRQLYERGMAEIVRETGEERVARLHAEDPERCPACGMKGGPNTLCKEGHHAPRPACIPSHIPDTDWTVIEGRAVWREDDWLRIADSDPRQIAWLVPRDEECLSKGPAFRADVPQSLFLAARRWMGWEKGTGEVDGNLRWEVSTQKRHALKLVELVGVFVDSKRSDAPAWSKHVEHHLAELRDTIELSLDDSRHCPHCSGYGCHECSEPPTRTEKPLRTAARYRPKTDVQKLSKLVEECGEVLAAAGKTMRWGLDSTNPELPPEQQETNAAWLARELCDLEEAIGFAREVLAAHEGGAP